MESAPCGTEALAAGVPADVTCATANFGDSGSDNGAAASTSCLNGDGGSDTGYGAGASSLTGSSSVAGGSIEALRATRPAAERAPPQNIRPWRDADPDAGNLARSKTFRVDELEAGTSELFGEQVAVWGDDADLYDDRARSRGGDNHIRARHAEIRRDRCGELVLHLLIKLREGQGRQRHGELDGRFRRRRASSFATSSKSSRAGAGGSSDAGVGGSSDAGVGGSSDAGAGGSSNCGWLLRSRRRRAPASKASTGDCSDAGVGGSLRCRRRRFLQCRRRRLLQCRRRRLLRSRRRRLLRCRRRRFLQCGRRRLLRCRRRRLLRCRRRRLLQGRRRRLLRCRRRRLLQCQRRDSSNAGAGGSSGGRRRLLQCRRRRFLQCRRRRLLRCRRRRLLQCRRLRLLQGRRRRRLLRCRRQRQVLQCRRGGDSSEAGAGGSSGAGAGDSSEAGAGDSSEAGAGGILRCRRWRFLHRRRQRLLCWAPAPPLTAPTSPPLIPLVAHSLPAALSSACCRSVQRIRPRSKDHCKPRRSRGRASRIREKHQCLVVLATHIQNHAVCCACQGSTDVRVTRCQRGRRISPRHQQAPIAGRRGAALSVLGECLCG